MIVLKGADGTEIARREGFQHNRKLRSGGAWDDAAVKELVHEVMQIAPSV